MKPIIAMAVTHCAVLILSAPDPASASSSRIGSGIEGSVHDLRSGDAARRARQRSSSTGRWNPRSLSGAQDFLREAEGSLRASGRARAEICRACHIPGDHGRATYGDSGIPWDRRSSTKMSWAMYGSDETTLDWVAGGEKSAPLGSSKLCLGCHDGVAAINQYDGRGSDDGGLGTGLRMGGGSSALGSSHPVSIVYARGANSQLRDPTGARLGSGLSVQSLLENGRIECATCHDVHNSDVSSGGAMLRGGDSGPGGGSGGLCLSCHDK